MKHRKQPKKKRPEQITSDKEMMLGKEEINVQPKSQPTISLADKPERTGTFARGARRIESKAQHKLELRNELSAKAQTIYRDGNQIEQDVQQDLPREEPSRVRNNRSRCASLDLKAPRAIVKKRSMDTAGGELANHSASNERRNRPLDFEAQNANLKVKLLERHSKGESREVKQAISTPDGGRARNGRSQWTSGEGPQKLLIGRRPARPATSK
jgi:hypothetical protein